MQRLTRAWGSAKLALNAKAPTILVVGGIVTMGAAAVAAGVQSRKLEKTLEPHVGPVEAAASIPTNDETAGAKLEVYGNATFDVVKLFAVPTVLFVGGAGMTFYGHNLLVQRNAALAVAFTGLFNQFQAYRARVVEKQGDAYDQYYMHGSSKISGALIGENPNETYDTRDWAESGNDPYNRVFGQNTTNQWQNDLGSNKTFVCGVQRMSQQVLNRQGYLYLSDVYDSLGFPQSDISRVVGWRVRTLPDGSHDIPIVDFGLDKPLPDDWKYNREKAIYLDFNCQGLIVGGKIQQMIESA